MPLEPNHQQADLELGWIDAARGGGRVIPFRSAEPEMADCVFLAPGSVIIGRARLGARSSVWFGSVIRADIAPIEIGEDTNIQDGGILHVGDEFPCIVGARVVVGHRATLHGCKVGDESLIGMGATVLNGAVIGERSIVAAGALVTEKTIIPPESLVMGAPAKVIRGVTPKQIESTIHFAHKYARLAKEYLDSMAGR